MASTSSLLTDHYELTMLRAALADGTADRRCVFSVFTRALAPGRRFGVVAGIERLLDELERFRFDDADIAFLRDRGIVDAATAQWLARFRFRADVDGYGEGDLFFPHSPVLVVEGTFAECVLLETLALSILNHDSAVASAAARMVAAAGNRPCIEMGSRRTHEQAALAAARAAVLVGFTATSNLAAGQRYGLPTTGTAAHAFTLLHDNEADAFRSQVSALGSATTLLVDTYDVEAAVRTAVAVTGPRLGAVRLDSGDLISQAIAVRAELDALGARDTRIIVTSDLDEHTIAALASAPVDGYGVGTCVVTGSGAPTCGFVYKLGARAASADPAAALVPVAKRSPGKASYAGRPYAVRRHDERGLATAEAVGFGAAPEPAPGDRQPLVPLVRGGEVVGREPFAAATERHRAALAAMPARARQLSRGEPALPTDITSAL